MSTTSHAVVKKRTSPIEVAVLFTAFVATTQAFGVYLFSALVSDIRASLGFDESAVGVITGAGQAGHVVFAALSSFLIPRLGAVRCLFLFLSITVVGQIVFRFLDGELSVIVVMFVLGGCAAAVWVAIMVACQSLIAPRHRATALGLMSSGTSFGLCVNGLVLPALLNQGGWRLPWLVLAGVTAVVLVLSMWRLRAVAPPPEPATAESAGVARVGTRGHLRQISSSPAAVFAVVLSFGTALCLVPFQTYLSLLLREGASWSTDAAARAWSVMGIGGMVGGLILGAIADRTSIKWTLVVTFLITTVTVPVPLLLPQQTTFVYVAILLFGMCYFALFGLIAAYTTKRLRAEIVPVFSGVSFLAVGLGSMIGNFAGGQIAGTSHGFSLLYLGIAAFSGVLAVVGSLAPPDHRSS